MAMHPTQFIILMFHMVIPVDFTCKGESAAALKFAWFVL
jgi:hypothetical protein